VTSVTAPSDDLPYPDRAQGLTFMTLAATPTAVSCSRQLVRLTLNRWGLAALVEDAELVMSELVTNSVQATGMTDAEPTWADLGDLATIQVRVLLDQAGVAIEVWDRDPTAPVQDDPTADEEGGRGLTIVAALCKQWHHFPSSRGGKVVRAELAIPPQLLTPTGLPRRLRSTPLTPTSPDEPIRDHFSHLDKDPCSGS
jgi:anti-sigma regulatory factor (Ser/Thr protein kinase)